MKTYIALLRGINVSGKNKIKMADLRSHLAELDYQDIQTYIQSGNIVFRFTETDPRLLQAHIHNKIAEKYGFDVPVLVTTADIIEHVLGHNPFQTETEENPKNMYITFLSEIPAEDRIALLSEVDYSPEERYVLEGTIIYFYCQNGYGRVKMNNNFFERKLKVRATTRNWKTTRKLWEMGS